MSDQPALNGVAAAHKPRTIRKTRIDKGVRRKPDPTEREAWREYFMSLTVSEQSFELGYLTALAKAAEERANREVVDDPPEVAS